MKTYFSKYSGCGNDFIIIDNRYLSISASKHSIQRICHRQNGIGADGLIFLETSKLGAASYKMRIFNNDGSEAEMCGNGLRCLAHFIQSIESPSNHFKIETMHECVQVSFNENLINVYLPPPSKLLSKRISLNQKEILLYFIDIGVPHAVYFVDDIEKKDLFLIAPLIRFHKEFAPKGTNVNFAKFLQNQTLAIRTYERGVEQETLACGTGAVAVALAAERHFQLNPPLQILTRSGDFLHINFKKQDPITTDLIMTGPALKIFDGQIDLTIFGFPLKSSAPIQ